jgi:putative endonuclease
MDEKTELARKGEELAALSLLSKGYTILKRNFKFLRAEVDIIATIGNEIVFVEVKTRFSSYLTDPALLVPISKQKQIIKVADYFVKENCPEKEWRFDIMIVVTNNQYTNIEHIEDAFYPMA